MSRTASTWCAHLQNHGAPMNLVHTLLHCDAIPCYGYGECAYIGTERRNQHGGNSCVRACMMWDFYSILCLYKVSSSTSLIYKFTFQAHAAYMVGMTALDIQVSLCNPMTNLCGIHVGARQNIFVRGIPTEITSHHLEILEKFVINVYYSTKSSVKDLDVERMDHFSRLPNSDLRSIAPSRLGLLEHIKRTCFQAGWLWAGCRANVMLPKPGNWGWHKDERGSYIHTWQITHQPLMKIDDVTFTCTCQKSRCKNCKCTRTQVKCLPFCKCQMDCDNNW